MRAYRRRAMSDSHVTRDDDAVSTLADTANSNRHLVFIPGRILRYGLRLVLFRTQRMHPSRLKSSQ